MVPRASAEERRFTAALKVLVIAADVAGSAVTRKCGDPAAWWAGQLCPYL